MVVKVAAHVKYAPAQLTKPAFHSSTTRLYFQVSVTAVGTFCGAAYTHHTLTPIVKEQIKLQQQKTDCLVPWLRTKRMAAGPTHPWLHNKTQAATVVCMHLVSRLNQQIIGVGFLSSE